MAQDSVPDRPPPARGALVPISRSDEVTNPTAPAPPLAARSGRGGGERPDHGGRARVRPIGRRSLQVSVATLRYGARIESGTELPLPGHPVLAEYAAALDEAGHWAEILDASMRVVYVSRELVRAFADSGRSPHQYLGCHYFGPEAKAVRADEFEASFVHLFPEVLASCPGGRDELRGFVAPQVQELVDQLPVRAPRLAVTYLAIPRMWGIDFRLWVSMLRVVDADGALTGHVMLSKPAAGMTTLGTFAGGGDVRHLERANRVVAAGRRPSAILFADLDGSTTLARRLPTPDYFRLARRLVRDVDQCVVDAGGLVGRHVGDGVSAFFLADELGSESAAVRAAIETTRSITRAAGSVAERHGLAADEVSFRFGLHWGATPYVGLIKSVARSEVTALGDEVNEAARLEASARRGCALATKTMIERLEPADAAALGIDLAQVVYAPLGELPTATDKARRDAANVIVCDI